MFTFALVMVTAAVYFPARHLPFISIDDASYVVYNFQIQHLNLDTVKWAFTTYQASNWHPLTWISHALDYRLFGISARRHHEMNVAFHILNSMVLFWVLVQATRRRGRSFVVAALFALHPINVETVAWVAERKNLLSMFFFLLTLGAYYIYARRPTTVRYLPVATIFALGLLCKPQIITLPFVLLLWDYWPLRRMFAAEDATAADGSERHRIPAKSFSWLVLEKVPLLILSAASAVLTMKAQKSGGAVGDALSTFSLSERLGNAVMSYVRYLANVIWPTRLVFFYPHARTFPPVLGFAGALLLLAAVTVWVLMARNRRYLAVGWFWYLGTLVPMIGLVQAGSQAMADRYAYLPLIGIFIAACWGVADWAQRWEATKVLAFAAACVVLLLLGFATRRQISYWADDLTLWTHTAEVTSANYIAENMLGEALLRKGEIDDAMAHFRVSSAMEPQFTFPRMHIGMYDEEHGHPQEAIEQFQKILDLTAQEPSRTVNLRTMALVHMSYVYNQLGDYTNEQKYLKLAVEMQQR